MSNLPVIYPIGLGVALGFLLCVLMWVIAEKIAERRQRRDPTISNKVLAEARRLRREDQ